MTEMISNEQLNDFGPTRGVIFDCDGTLLDSLGAWNELELYMVQQAGEALTLEMSSYLATLTMPETAQWWHEKFSVGSSADAVLDDMVDFLHTYYAERVRPRVGVPEFLDELASRGIRMSVASSSSEDLLHVGLKACGLIEYFDRVLSVDMVGAPKREPKIYLTACDIMGTTPSDTWGVDDALYAIHTLNKAGFRSLGIYSAPESGAREDLLRDAYWYIDEFSEVNVEEFLSK